MKPSARELWWALAAIIAITAIYLAVVNRAQAVPASSGLFGHGIGGVGFVLMLATETFYTLRKRSRRARWGRPASWLRLHIFTGLVGPYMVLLHSSWKFQGLAGLVMLMTVVVVASGFVGRYIYTAVPRTADGMMLEASDLQNQIAEAEAELQRWLVNQPELAQAVASARDLGAKPQPSQTGLIFGRAFARWRSRRRWRRAVRQMDAPTSTRAVQLQGLVERRQSLERQASSLAAARRLLGVWHSIHIPLGLALFTAAFVHIAAALYYATLLH